MAEHLDDGPDYLVVCNAEEQYSVWLVHRPLPNGWRREGFQGSRSACIAHIDGAWRDMRPLSVRQQAQRQDA